MTYNHNSTLPEELVEQITEQVGPTKAT
jgi:hypothetical protein